MAWRHFKVRGKFGYSYEQDASVAVDQEADLIEIRVHRSREVLTSTFTSMVEGEVMRLLRKKADDERTKPKRRTFAKLGFR